MAASWIWGVGSPCRGADGGQGLVAAELAERAQERDLRGSRRGRDGRQQGRVALVFPLRFAADRGDGLLERRALARLLGVHEEADQARQGLLVGEQAEGLEGFVADAGVAVLRGLEQGRDGGGRAACGETHDQRDTRLGIGRGGEGIEDGFVHLRAGEEIKAVAGGVGLGGRGGGHGLGEERDGRGVADSGERAQGGGAHLLVRALGRLDGGGRRGRVAAVGQRVEHEHLLVGRELGEVGGEGLGRLGARDVADVAGCGGAEGGVVAGEGPHRRVRWPSRRRRR